MNRDVDTERDPLTKNDHNKINDTDKDGSNSIIDHQKIRKKKLIKRGIIGGIILIIVILVIVLPIVLTRKKDDNNNPPDNPDVP